MASTTQQADGLPADLASTLRSVAATLLEIAREATAEAPELPPGHIQVFPQSPRCDAAIARLNMEMNGARKWVHRVGMDAPWELYRLSSPEGALALVWYLETLLRCLAAILPTQPTEVPPALLAKMKKLKGLVLGLGKTRTPPLTCMSQSDRTAWRRLSKSTRDCSRVVVTRERADHFCPLFVDGVLDWCTAVAQFCRALPMDLLPGTSTVADLARQLRYHKEVRAVLVQHAAPHRTLFSGVRGATQTKFFAMFSCGLGAFDVDKRDHLTAAVDFFMALLQDAHERLQRGIRKPERAAVYEAARVGILEFHRDPRSITTCALAERIETVDRADVFAMLALVFAVTARMHHVVHQWPAELVRESMEFITDMVGQWPVYTAGA